MSEEIIPTGESQQSRPPSYEELSQAFADLNRQFQEYQFLLDPTRFNSIIYQGISLLLEKVTKIEEKLSNGVKG